MILFVYVMIFGVPICYGLMIIIDISEVWVIQGAELCENTLDNFVGLAHAIVNTTIQYTINYTGKVITYIIV